MTTAKDRLFSHLAVGLLGLSCRSGDPVARAPTRMVRAESERPGATAPVQTSPPPRAATPLETTCAELAREQVAAVAGTPLGGFQQSKPPGPLPASFGRCLRTPHGAWLGMVTALGEDPPAEVACWALVHVDLEGHRARVFPGTPSADRCEMTFLGANLVWGNYSNPSLDEPMLADLDADGEPEILVPTSGYNRDRYFEGKGELWTFRDGGVVPYPPTAGIGVLELRDVDGDGRLDLVTHDAFSADGFYLCGMRSNATFEVVGPKLLGHGLPDGAFSFGDPTAVAFARQQCPQPPARVGGKDGDVGLGIGCALLWGASVRAVQGRLASCALRPDERDEYSCPEWCEQDQRFVKEFGRRQPRLRLHR